jgi:hypothetical protein
MKLIWTTKTDLNVHSVDMWQDDLRTALDAAARELIQAQSEWGKEKLLGCGACGQVYLGVNRFGIHPTTKIKRKTKHEPHIKTSNDLH